MKFFSSSVKQIFMNSASLAGKWKFHPFYKKLNRKKKSVMELLGNLQQSLNPKFEGMLWDFSTAFMAFGSILRVLHIRIIANVHKVILFKTLFYSTPPNISGNTSNMTFI